MKQKSVSASLVAFAVFWGVFASSAAQEAQPPTQASETPAAAESPPRADLSEANELVRNQDYAAAEQLLGKLQKDFPDDVDLLVMRGELLLALKRPEQARGPLLAAGAIEPTRPRLQFQLGSALAATGDTEGAIEAFGKELENSEDPQVLVFSRINRSMLFQQRKDWDAAIAELEAVLALDPSRTPVYGDLVALQLQAGAIDQAIETLTRGEAAGFRSAAHWYSVAARLLKEGEDGRAAELLRKALATDPDFADAERSLAAALDGLGQKKEAVAHLRRYLELRPDAPDADVIRARIDGTATD